jgi:hypothetical protein
LIPIRTFDEAAMTQALHFDPYFRDDPLGDGAIQAMAQRQISVSVVVGIAIICIAAFLTVREPQVVSSPLPAQHAVTTQAPRHV